MKSNSVKTGYRGCLSWTLGAWALLVCAGIRAQELLPNPIVVIVTPQIQNLQPLPALDAKRLYALGMIETGNDDREVGAAGEVSRYQIHPVVWKAYSQSADYRNPAVSVQVAQRHWARLAEYFRVKTGRQPEDFDMYVMWNTTYGYYAKKGFSATRIGTVVRDRAQRFVNLVNRQG